MYSVVLMAALTTGSATPDWLHHGWYGCWGGCYGCWGGCCGGFGGCFGYGCCGGGFGCCGGGFGCCGGGFGCCGGGFGCCGGGFGCCGGCCGGGCCGGGGFGAPTYPDGIAPGNGLIAPGTGAYLDNVGTPPGELLGTPAENKSKDRDKKDQGMKSSMKARLIVEVPTNAKLFIDDIPVKVKAGVRSFRTPDLEPGQLYYYVVRIERMRDGKPISETRRIIVQAGQVARADFKDLESEAVRTAQVK
jgi:uncharacterized protein (TIGR03000 family)